MSRLFQARKTSLSTQRRDFHEVLCIKYNPQEELDVFHILRTPSKYSAGMVVDYSSTEISID